MQNSNNEYAELIGTASTPNKARILAGQKISHQYKWMEELNEIINRYKDKVALRTNWEQVKKEVMLTVLRLKFKTDEHCRKILLSTGSASLVENSPRDSYWGISKNGKGENHLGKLLMQVRSELA